MAERLRNESERIEVAAWRDVFACAPSQARELGLRVVVRGGIAALVAPGIDHILFNRAIGLGADRPATADEVRGLLDVYVTSGVRRFFVHCSEDARPDHVGHWLANVGLVRYPRAWIKLGGALGAVSRARTSVEIARLGRRHVEAASALLASGFDLPPVGAALLGALVERPRWHLFGAFDAGHLVAAAGLFVEARTAYLTFAVTSPEQRMRGAQAALIERRLRTALALGCTHAVAETGEASSSDRQHSFNNLVSAGLAPLGRRENWTLPGTRW